MKKIKQKKNTPIIPTNNIQKNNMPKNNFPINAKMSPEEMEQHKQETLRLLRKSIKDIIGENNVNIKELPPKNDMNEIIKQKPLNEKEVELLRSRCSEYLGDYVLYGYDFRGERVLITSCKTTQDRDAIVSMSQQIPFVLMQMFNQGRMPDGEHWKDDRPF